MTQDTKKRSGHIKRQLMHNKSQVVYYFNRYTNNTETLTQPQKAAGIGLIVIGSIGLVATLVSILII